MRKIPKLSERELNLFIIQEYEQRRREGINS